MSDDNNNDYEGDWDQLTKEEETKCWEYFSVFDKDSSGYIDANELIIVLEMMGQKTTEEKFFRMIAEAHAENTGCELTKTKWDELKHARSQSRRDRADQICK